MSVEINFDMPTKYIPEYKDYLEDDNLYNKCIEKVSVENRDKDIKNIMERNDSDGVLYQLKDTFNLDVDSYCRNDEEKFNVFKLKYFLAIDHFHNPYSIFKIAKDSIKKVSYDDFYVDSEYYKKCISILSQGANNSDTIERVTEMIDNQFGCLITKLYIYSSFNSYFGINEINHLEQHLKNDIIKLEEKNVSYESNENVIDVFYTILKSSHIIAETVTRTKDYYDELESNSISTDISSLILDNFFSSSMTWKEFSKRINRNLKKFNIDDNETKMIWSVLLNKTEVTQDDVNSIDKYVYSFIIEHANHVADVWKKETGIEEISVFDWIVIVKELAHLRSTKKTYEYKPTGSIGNRRPTLISEIKKAPHIPEIPKQILLKRLSFRDMMIRGTTDKLKSILAVENQILKLKKIILSNHDITYMEREFRNVFFHLSTITESLFPIFEMMNFQNKVNAYVKNINITLPYIKFFSQFDSSFTPRLLKILSLADNYIKKRDTAYKNMIEERSKYLHEHHNEDYDAVIYGLGEIGNTVAQPVLISDILANGLAEDIVSIYETSKKGKYKTPVYGFHVNLEENMKYICNVYFDLDTETNTCEYTIVKIEAVY